jgi:membrane fusion protein (multidrug efflux system)
MRSACLSLALAACLFSIALPGGAAAQTAAPQAVPVGVITAEPQAVNRPSEYVGRVEAMERVGVTARVVATLMEVQFTEGAMVQAGAPLYKLDRAPFEAAVKDAQGALFQAQAVLTNATLQRQRAEELARTQAGTVAERDTRIAAEQSAQGSVMRAEAALANAAINLGYTEITSPIEGRIGRTVITRGNTVGPDSGVLTTIVKQDPMFVTFPVSQRDFLELRRSGANEGQASSYLVRLRFSDGTTYGQEGRIDFVDVAVDRATDTILVRAKVANPQRELVDGQFVRVSVTGEKPEMKVVIPQAALLADQEGVYVFVVQDGRAVARRVVMGGETPEGGAIVEKGLEAGDKVIATGLQLVRPNAPVMASPLPAATATPPTRQGG